MKQSKQILFFTLSVVGFATFECLLTALLSPLVEESLFLSRIFPYAARLLAVIPPFLALGTAVGAIRVRGLGYSLLFIGIYAAVSLFAQIPISLFAYSEADSAPYALLLFSYMLSAAVTALLFLFALLLGYAIFLQNERVSEDTPLFSLQGKDARALALAAALLTLYHLIREVIDIFGYVRDNLYIVAWEDLLFMLLSLFFFLALGVFCFCTGRVAECIFSTAPSLPASEEDDFI
ncbi:MAG: hypothetical protein E7609_01820 [Ruminococcaceae bacterium]|nr:hypothetical protein [Oscillospiraceae bacterium]